MSLKFNTHRSERYLRSRFIEGRYLLASENTDLQLEMIDKSRQTIRASIGNIAIDSGLDVELYKVTTEVTNVIGTTLSLDTTLLDLVILGDEVLKNGVRVESVSSVNIGANSITMPSIGTITAGDTIEIKVRNTLLINKGEAWHDGIPFMMQSGEDNLFSGSNLALGITVPIGGGSANMTAKDEPQGLGKLLTFNDGGTTPVGNYRIVLSAREEVVTNIEDPFLKNANIPESTAQKMRLTYRINVVPENSQASSPVPYTDSNVAGNLVNQVTITPTPGGEGSEASRVTISGSEEIDGRNLEINLRNTIGSNKLPSGSSEQQEYTNGKLIDSIGNEYHINLITNATVANQVTMRIDKAFGQPNPKITDNVPYTIRKRDVFVTDDVNGNPQGQLFYSIATVKLETTTGFNHSSNISDLRGRVISKKNFEEVTNVKFDLRLTDGGVISWEVIDTDILDWAAGFAIVNPHGPEQSISAGTAALVSGASLLYYMDLENGGPIEKGNQAVTVASGTTVLTLSSNPDLTEVRVGNVIKVGTDTRYITEINDISKTVTVDSAISTSGAATIYLDTYAQGFAPIKEDIFILATRRNDRVYFSNLELSSGESSNIGSSLPQALLDYIGTPSENVSTPEYGDFQVTTITTVVAADITDADMFFISSAYDAVDYYVWFNKSGVAVDPAPILRTGVEVDISAATTADEVATAIAGALGALGDFGAVAGVGSVVVTNANIGSSTPAQNITGAVDLALDTDFGSPSIVTNGVSLTTSIIDLDKGLQEINDVLDIPIYDETVNFPAGLPALTSITLPINSRYNDAIQLYIPDTAALQLFRNGSYVEQDEVWQAIDENNVRFVDALPADTKIHFRLASLGGANSPSVISGGGGGVSWNTPVDSSVVPDVTNAYDLGSPTKMFKDGYFNGDFTVNGKLTVGGLIDPPTGLELEPQVSSPLGATRRGIWVDTATDSLVFETGSSSTNITEELATLQSSAGNISRLNNTGSSIAQYRALYSPVAGEIALADATNATKFKVIGISNESIADSVSGVIKTGGLISGVTGLTHNSYVYLGVTPGTLVDNVSGLPSGANVIRLGVVDGTDIHIQIQYMGTKP